MAQGNLVELTLTISLLATLLGTLGFFLAFKDYIASFMAGLIFRNVKHIMPETRVKLLGSQTLKRRNSGYRTAKNNAEGGWRW